MLNQSQQLRNLFQSEQLYLAPGVYNGLSAKLVEQAGFSIGYATGGGIARSMGLPDLQLMSFTQITERVAEIVDAVDIPIIADADNGYGNALNASHTAKFFWRAGVAAIHIEDQSFPKRCGHYKEKQLIPAQEHVQKIQAIKAVVPDLFIIARTDAIAVEGLNSAIERAYQYIEAGAEMIFIEAPTTVEQIETIAQKLNFPTLLNMFDTGKTPIMPLKKLAALGYQLVIVPSDLQRSAIWAMRETLNTLQSEGNTQSIRDRLITFKERESIIGTDKYV